VPGLRLNGTVNISTSGRLFKGFLEKAGGCWVVLTYGNHFPGVEGVSSRIASMFSLNVIWVE